MQVIEALRTSILEPRDHLHIKQMSMPKPVRARTWRPPLPSARRAPRRRRKQHARLLELDARRRQRPSSLRAWHGRSLPRCGELTFRTPGRHRAANMEPGRILSAGDGAAGEYGAQNRPVCLAMALRDACGPSHLNDFLALWSQAHMPSCNRQVTSTTVHTAKPGPASAPRGHAPL
jgi:hypothetical protein